MIDTHAHIRKGDEIRIEGLKWVLLAGANVEESEENIRLAKINDKLWAAIGIHPQEKIKNYELQITNLERLLQENRNVVAVGECGLEFTNPPESPFDKGEQEQFFKAQIELAIKYDKPLIVHSRKAMEETLEILGSYRDLRGVIHCYSGGIKRIKKVLELPGVWYFGIDGNLTYEEGVAEVVKNIPKDRIVLETDSPELAPVPHRGERNYPEYVRFTYEKLAEIWGMSFGECDAIVDTNAENCFS